MSKQQSWDGWRNRETGNAAPRRGDILTDCPQRVRVVAWPEGAPPPEEVPHAGTRVQWPGMSPQGVVVNGIPWNRGHGWHLDFRTDDGAVFGAPLGDLRPLPEKRTASGEVVGRMVCTDDNELEVLSGFTLMPGKSYALIREDT